MKTLKFAAELVPLVISGEKSSTWRIFDDKNLQAGDELILINKATLKEFATAQIESIKEKAIVDIDESDFAFHEKFASPDKMLKNYQSWYGDAVNKDTILKMIKFQLLKILE